MSRSNSWTAMRRQIILAMVLAAGGAAAAEMVDASPKAAKTKPTPVESMARIPDDAPRSVLKCWQEGRLVFESSGIGSETTAGASRTFKGGNGRSVQVLDLRQGLCILERSNG